MLEAKVNVKLMEQLHQLPCFKDLLIQNIEATPTGLNQKSYRVVCANKQQFFAKKLMINSPEVVGHTIAAQIGISPELYYADQHWLVSEFIESQELSTQQISLESKLSIMLKLLVVFHKEQNLESNSGDGSLPALERVDFRVIFSQLLSNTTLSKQQIRSLRHITDSLLNELPTFLQQVQPELVLCHGDANFSNVISAQNKHYLIDFECACVAPIEYELAMLMAINGLSSDDSSLVISSYHRALQQQLNHTCYFVPNIALLAKIQNKLVTCYYVISLLINVLWCFQQLKKERAIHIESLLEQQLILLEKHLPIAKTLHI